MMIEFLWHARCFRLVVVEQLVVWVGTLERNQQ